MLEAVDEAGSKAEVFAVICKVPAVTVPVNTNVFDVVLVFVIEESVRLVVPADMVKSLVAAVVLNPVEVTIMEAPLFPVVIVEEVAITGVGVGVGASPEIATYVLTISLHLGSRPDPVFL